ncbi:MAG: hypothetical protein MHM6MM_001213 [Cercozoa sp. M6MM]
MLGMEHPSKIQDLCIPEVLKGRDVIGRSHTGSGKTACFALPLLQKLSEDPYGVFGVVLTPARELAFQIAQQFDAFGKTMNCDVACITGGGDFNKEARALEQRPHVIVATPGRLAAHLRNATPEEREEWFEYTRFLVLDEADRLLEGGFRKDLDVILSACRNSQDGEEDTDDSERLQVLLFSATMSTTMKEIGDVAMKDALLLETTKQEEHATPDSLEQTYIFVPPKLKLANVLALLKEHTEDSAILFVNTRRKAALLTETLRQLVKDMPISENDDAVQTAEGSKGDSAVLGGIESLHGGMEQRRRLAALGKFRCGKARILVATDVAARGLDIPQVGLVINVDVPRKATDYVHRVGRTARAGRKGKSVTLLTQYEVELFQEMEELIDRKIQEHEFDQHDGEAILDLVKPVNTAEKLAALNLQRYEMKEQQRMFRDTYDETTLLTKRPRSQQVDERKTKKSRK